MKNSRLIKQLSILDETERISLNQILISPYFNKNPKCKQLYDIAMQYHPDFDHPDFTKEKVFFLLFPTKKKLNSSLSTVMTGLIEMINELKIQEELKQQQHQRDHLLLNSLIKHGELEYFETTYKKTSQLLENKPRKNIDHYHSIYLLQNDFIKFNNLKKDRINKVHLNNVIHSLDVFYLTKKLNLTCELLNLKGMMQFDYELDLLKNIDKIVEQEKFKDYPLIQLYHAGLKILKNQGDNRKEINEFIEVLSFTDVRNITNSELDELYTIAINQCIKKIVEGQEDYKTILFNIYKILVEHGLLYRSGYIILGRMKNIITLACQLNETEWALEFNENSKPGIIKKQREGAYNWHLAIIHFYKKEFKQTMEYLFKAEETDFFRSLNSKALLIKCYYELMYRDAFYNLIKTYRAYIRQNKVLNTFWKTAHENFAKIAYQLYRKKEGLSKKSKADILQKINSYELISDKAWLLEKLEELK